MSKKKLKETPQKENKKSKQSLLTKIIPVALIAAVIIYLIASNFFKKPEKDSEYVFRKDGELTFIDSSSGQTKAKIDIQIAATDFDRELGLMFRKQMDMDRGMLFIFPQADVQNFWMRNTFIPLDMIFVNSDKKVVTIRHADKTLSDQTYSSTAPAQYVIEVDLGFADKYNIKVGDKISWVRTNSTP